MMVTYTKEIKEKVPPVRYILQELEEKERDIFDIEGIEEIELDSPDEALDGGEEDTDFPDVESELDARMEQLYFEEEEKAERRRKKRKNND